MSILKYLNTNNNEENRSNLKAGIGHAATAGLIGFAGYSLFKDAGLKNSAQSILDSVKGNATTSSIGQTGVSVRSNIDILREAMETARTETLKKFRDEVMSSDQLEGVLNGSNLEERRALLAGLLETVESSGDVTDLTIKDALRKSYSSETTLQDTDIQNIRRFYEQNISTSNETLTRFKSSHSRLKSVSHLLIGEALDFVSGTGEVFNKTNFNQLKSGKLTNAERQILSRVQTRFNAIQGMVGASVSLEQIDERIGRGGIKSLYARIAYGDGTLNIPLHLQRNTEGLAFFRGTENGSTRYVPPLRVLNGLDVVASGYSPQSYNSALVSFEDFIYSIFEKNFSGGQAQYVGKREINAFHDMMRSMGEQAPRGMVRNLTKEQDLLNALEFSRMIQSSNIFISGLEKPDDFRNFVNRSMILRPDIFQGPGASQTVDVRMQDPFNQDSDLRFQKISLNALPSNGGTSPTFTTLNALRGYGGRVMDRIIQPQTAREQQMIGRPEVISGFRGMTSNATIGLNKDINVVASGRDLIGISDTNISQRMQGINLANFMVLGDQRSAQLGLSEGQAYTGGRFRLKQALTKTVADTGAPGSFALMKELERLRAAGSGPMIIGEGGNISIDDFFKKYGAGGAAILGLNDNSFSEIKKHTGLTRMQLEITEYSEEAGRRRAHVGGFVEKELPFMKLFGPSFKGTLEPIQQQQIQSRLEAMGFGDQFAEFMRGTTLNTAVFTDESMIKKSPYYLATQMFGGLKYFGGDEAVFESTLKGKIGDDTSYLNAIKAAQAGDFSELEKATVTGRQAGYLTAFAESVLEAGKKNNLTNQQMGMIFGGFYSLGERFGIQQGVIESILGADISAEAKKGIAVGATFASPGDVYTDLSRNLARVEPRFANYLYQNLRTSFGMDEAQASKYIYSIISNKKGIESVGGMLGMKLSQLSLASSSKAPSLRDALSGLDTRVVDQQGISDLLTSRSEKETIDILSQSKGGNIIDIADIGLDKKAEIKLQEALGGKTSFFLAGADTFESMGEYSIRRSGENINIESEYKRYSHDLVMAISSLKDAGGDDDQIKSAIKGFQTSRALMGKTTADVLRNALSGEILGSGTYRGRGISLGKELATSGVENLGGKLQNGFIRQRMQAVFDKTAGYALVADAQAFMDGMTGFKEVIRRDALSRGVKGKDVNAEVKKVMGESLRSFFLGIYEDKPTGFMVDAQRNPIIGPSNIFANIEMFRGDLAESGGEDSFFKLLARQTKPGSIENRLALEQEIGYEAGDTAKQKRIKREKYRFKASVDTIVKDAGIGDIIGLTDEQRAAAQVLYNDPDIIETTKAQHKAARESFKLKLKEYMGLDSGDAIRRYSTMHQYLRGEDPRDLGVDRQVLELSRIKYNDLDAAQKQELKQLHSAYSQTGRIRKQVFEQAQLVRESSVYKGIPHIINETLLRKNYRSLSTLEDIAKVERGSFGGFEDIQKARSSLTGSQLTDFDTELDKQLRGMLSQFTRSGSQGGGTVSFFDIKIGSSDIVDNAGRVIGSFSGRADINRAGIGDFDGDIYQVFFRANQDKIYQSSPNRFMTSGVEMSMMMDQLSEGMKKLGQRMGVDDLVGEAFRISEKEKERILKGVGGVDVQIKTAMLGLAQSMEEAADPGVYSNRMRAGMTLLASLEEVLVIQSKKLPRATAVPEELVKSLKEGFRTGSADNLKRFLMENIFQGTALGESGEISLRNVEFENIPEALSATSRVRSAYEDARLNLNEIFESLDAAMAAVKKYGFDQMASTSRLSNALTSGSVANIDMLQKLLSEGMTMEGGVIGGSADSMARIEEIMRTSKQAARETGARIAGRLGGLGIAAGLVASYAIGTMMTPQPLEGSSRFSDQSTKRALSDRNLSHMMSRQSTEIPVSSIGSMDNFYERPIFSGETTVVSNQATRFYGEAATYSNAVDVGRRFIDAGGQANLSVNDARMPISSSYINKSLRD